MYTGSGWRAREFMGGGRREARERRAEPQLLGLRSRRGGGWEGTCSATDSETRTVASLGRATVRDCALSVQSRTRRRRAAGIEVRDCVTSAGSRTDVRTPLPECTRLGGRLHRATARGDCIARPLAATAGDGWRVGLYAISPRPGLNAVQSAHSGGQLYAIAPRTLNPVHGDAERPKSKYAITSYARDRVQTCAPSPRVYAIRPATVADVWPGYLPAPTAATAASGLALSDCTPIRPPLAASAAGGWDCRTVRDSAKRSRTRVPHTTSSRPVDSAAPCLQASGGNCAVIMAVRSGNAKAPRRHERLRGFALQSWARQDLNLRPFDYESSALTN
jgi:hypothetical protein